MRDVALVPQRDILETDDAVRADDARDAADAFRNDRIALVRHCARTLLTFREALLRLAHLGALPVTNVQSKLLQRRRDDRKRRQIFGVDVSLNDLSRYRRGLQSETRTDTFFNRRIQVCKRADRATDLSDCNCFTRMQQTFAIAAHLVKPECKS